jgi:3-isopropylmalate dehydrogenase
MKLVVWPGDGIGPETMPVTVEVLHAASRQFNLGLSLELDVAGHESLKRYGATVTSELLAKV